MESPQSFAHRGGAHRARDVLVDVVVAVVVVVVVVVVGVTCY